MKWLKRSGPTPVSQQKYLGQKGEELASRFLGKNGYRIIERNFRCKYGEIDLIARDGKTVVFVEVKTRTGGDFSPPYLAVNKAKRRKIKKSAEYYINLKKAGDIECRFDIVSIVTGEELSIEVIKRAF